MSLIGKCSINEHSSIRVGATKTLYFDPFRVAGEPGDADVVFFTHPHYDHFSPEDAAKVSNAATVYVFPRSMYDEALSFCPDETRLYPLSPGEELILPDLTVNAVRAYNVGKKFHPKANDWVGYVVDVAGERIYVCGDTDALSDEIAPENVDIMFVPVGGIYTTDPAEAAAFVRRVGPALAVPTHYGSIVGSGLDGAEFCTLVPGIKTRLLIR